MPDMEDYGLTLVTAATDWPVTLAEAREWCRAPDGQDNVLLMGLIQAALERAEHETRKHYVRQTWRMTLPYFPTWELVLPRSPVSSITSITYTDLNGDTQTVDPDIYVLSEGREPSFVEPVFGRRWPIASYGPNVVEITFVVGHARPELVPASVKLAVKMMTAHWYDNREVLAEDRKIAQVPFGIEVLLAQNATCTYY